MSLLEEDNTIRITSWAVISLLRAGSDSLPYPANLCRWNIDMPPNVLFVPQPDQPPLIFSMDALQHYSKVGSLGAMTHY